MKVEAIFPLRIMLHGRAIDLSPGHVIDIPFERVPRLLAQMVCQIWWRSFGLPPELGPVTVDSVHVTEEGQIWVFVTDEAGWRAIAATSIVKIRLVHPERGSLC